MTVSFLDLNDDVLCTLFTKLRFMSGSLDSLIAISSTCKILRSIALPELFRVVAFRRTWTAGNMRSLASSGNVLRYVRSLVFAPCHAGRKAGISQIPFGSPLFPNVSRGYTVIRPHWGLTGEIAVSFVRLLAGFVNLRKLVLLGLHLADSEVHLLQRTFIAAGMQLPTIETLELDDSCEFLLGIGVCPQTITLVLHLSGRDLNSSFWSGLQSVKRLELRHRHWKYAIVQPMALQVIFSNMPHIEFLKISGKGLYGDIPELLAHFPVLNRVRTLILDDYFEREDTQLMIDLLRLIFPGLLHLRLWQQLYEL